MKRIFPFTLLFVFSITACAPATEPVPTPTPVGFTAPSVEVIDTFYTSINNAQTQDDLFVSWDLLTNEAQCNPREKCELSNFQKKWWESKAAYKLYDCGPNYVIAEETRYSRNDGSLSTPAPPKFWRYQLVETADGLMIKDISGTQSPGDDCVLVSEQ